MLMPPDFDIGRALFPDGPVVRAYAAPLAEVTATTTAEVIPAFEALARHVGTGRHVAGYVAFEAAGAFDAALRTHPPGELPLLWFGVYDAPAELPVPDPVTKASRAFPWKALLDQHPYEAALHRIREHIAAGDTYQVNFTFPLEADFDATPEDWFWERLAAQEARYGAFLDTGRFKILSLSPELFFELDGTALTTRPMKGTRPRALDTADDEAAARDLANSPKDRAENLMIVDMLRNDLGRVCEVNSIEVSRLFSVERYPTVWQMTSTITGRSSAPVPEIFGALFPSASVTGAPKIETMKIIRALESGPRGVYCGAIGWWAPGRRARFNVAIRTATLDTKTGATRYPCGSGITWDSDPAQEYAECLQKAAVLQHPPSTFAIITALRLEPEGYDLLDLHIDRLEDSAAYFGFPVAREAVKQQLEDYRSSVSAFPAKVRAALKRDGVLTLTHDRLPPARPLRAGLALRPSNTVQQWTRHKTTLRAIYDEAQATRPDCEVVLLWSPEGHLTEATIANIVLRFGNQRFTPPHSEGLLPGVFRRHLLETGSVEERRLTIDDLAKADEILLINSVRHWIAIEWLPHPDAPGSVQDIR